MALDNTWKEVPNLYTTVRNFFNLLLFKNGTLFGPLYTKNPPQTTLRGIFVEHRRIELLTF